jgi:hypothetical protein
LSEEITHLLMRADHVERREVEALVTKVRNPSMPLGSHHPRKPEDLA